MSSGAFEDAKTGVASHDSSRKNAYARPVIAFEPERVITFRTPPEERPNSAVYWLVRTWNSWIQSWAYATR